MTFTTRIKVANEYIAGGNKVNFFSFYWCDANMKPLRVASLQEWLVASTDSSSVLEGGCWFEYGDAPYTVQLAPKKSNRVELVLDIAREDTHKGFYFIEEKLEKIEAFLKNI